MQDRIVHVVKTISAMAVTQWIYSYLLTTIPPSPPTPQSELAAAIHPDFFKVRLR
jgi:hypothetical protein